MITQIINDGRIISGSASVIPYTCFISHGMLFCRSAKFLYIDTSYSGTPTLPQDNLFIYVYKLSNMKNIASNDLADLKIDLSEVEGDSQFDFSTDISELEEDAVIVKFLNTATEDSDEYLYFLAYDVNKMQDRFYNLLTNYCNTCIDKAQKERILTAFFRYTLMHQAEEIQNIETAAKLYLDLDRILNLKDHCKTECIDNCSPCNSCNTCKNGICSL